MLRIVATFLVGFIATACQPPASKSESASSRSSLVPHEIPGAKQDSSPSSSTGLLKSPDFPVFWNGFRGALISGDYGLLASVTEFPLEVRGDTDADPRVQRDRSQFDETIRAILTQDSGMRPQEETVREFLQRAAAPGPRAVEPDGDAARMGDFVFERKQHRWLLVRVYRRNQG
jgi:hypothetical protein